MSCRHVAALVFALGVPLFGGCDEPGETAPMPAQEPRAEQFRSERVQFALDAASEIVRTRGFADEPHEWRGFLVEGTSRVREHQMTTGSCVVVLAAATTGIRELDLRVFDSEGSEVVQDDGDGAAAALLFCPSQVGTYYVTVRASAGSGLFEVRMLRGPTGLDIPVDDVFRSESPETGREPTR